MGKPPAGGSGGMEEQVKRTDKTGGRAGRPTN